MITMCIIASAVGICAHTQKNNYNIRREKANAFSRFYVGKIGNRKARSIENTQSLCLPNSTYNLQSAVNQLSDNLNRTLRFLRIVMQSIDITENDFQITIPC